MPDIFAGWSWADWTALVTGLIYVVLAARADRRCWWFGIISSALIARADFLYLRLYTDGILQLIYILMGVAGLLHWQREESNRSPLRTEGMRFHLPWVILSLVAALPLGWLFGTYTDAAFPYLDAWTTCLSLIATWLTVQRILENWIYWIVADVIYIGLYYLRGAEAFGVLFIIYTVLAVYGWFSWRKKIRMEAII